MYILLVDGSLSMMMLVVLWEERTSIPSFRTLLTLFSDCLFVCRVAEWIQWLNDERREKERKRRQQQHRVQYGVQYAVQEEMCAIHITLSLFDCWCWCSVFFLHWMHGSYSRSVTHWYAVSHTETHHHLVALFPSPLLCLSFGSHVYICKRKSFPFPLQDCVLLIWRLNFG